MGWLRLQPLGSTHLCGEPRNTTAPVLGSSWTHECHTSRLAQILAGWCEEWGERLCRGDMSTQGSWSTVSSMQLCFWNHKEYAMCATWPVPPPRPSPPLPARDDFPQPTLLFTRILRGKKSLSSHRLSTTGLTHSQSGDLIPCPRASEPCHPAPPRTPEPSLVSSSNAGLGMGWSWLSHAQLGTDQPKSQSWSCGGWRRCNPFLRGLWSC